MKDLHAIHENSPYFAEFVEGRRGEILDAALKVFVEKGYSGGSMREIAQRVGVTEPAIYRHFGSKEELFIALMKVGAIHIHAAAFGLIDGLEPGDLRTQLKNLLGRHRQTMGMYGPTLRTLLPAASRNPRFLTAYRELIVLPIYQRVCTKAAELDAALGVEGAEATREARVRAVMALAVGYFASSFVLQDEPDEAIVEAALRVMQWDGR